MFTKLEYGHLWKFLVSLGVTLVLLSLLIPYFFYTQSFDLHLTQLQINALTPVAQEIIANRQKIVLILLNIILIISAILFLLGMTASSIGIIQWVKKQKREDHKEEMELRELGLRIEKMSPSEIRARAIDEINADSDVRKAVRRYTDIEHRLKDLITQSFRSDYIVRKDYKIIKDNKGYAIDALLVAMHPDDPDILIEFKFYRHRPGGGLEAPLQRLAETTLLYSNSRKSSRACLYLVQPAAVLTPQRRKRYQLIVNNFNTRSPEAIVFIAVAEEDFLQFTPETFRAHWSAHFA